MQRKNINNEMKRAVM